MAGKAQESDKQGPVAASKTFLSDCNEELRKVTTPTRQETIQATLVTLVIVVFVSGTLAILDIIFNRLMTQIL